MVCRTPAAAWNPHRSGGMARNKSDGRVAPQIPSGAGIPETTALCTGNHGSGLFSYHIFQRFSLEYAAGRTGKGLFLSGLSDHSADGSLFL